MAIMPKITPNGIPIIERIDASLNTIFLICEGVIPIACKSPNCLIRSTTLI